MGKHGPPGIPVMWPFLSPDVELIPDSFIVKYFGKPAIGIRVFMCTAACEYMQVTAAAYLLKDIVIGKIRNIMLRTVEIYIFIIVAFCIFRKIIHTAHGNYTINKIRSF